MPLAAVHRAVAGTSAILGFLFNGYILLVLVYNRQIRTANNLLLLHLGLVDTFFCVQLLLTAVMRGPWLAEPTICAVHGFAWTALVPIVVWTLAGLNCDRYCAISAPLHYSRLVHTRRVIAFLVCTWLLSIALAVPPLLRINPYTYREARGGCTPDFADPSSGVWFCIVYTTTALLVPTALMIFCNVRVLLIARFHRHRIVSAIYEITLRAQATITHQRNPFYLFKFKGRCAVLTILQLLGSLLVLYFPYFSIVMVEAVTNQPHPDLLVAIVSGLIAFSPPTHGFVYGIKSRVLRKTFLNFLRRRLYRSEVNSEIQRQVSRRASLQLRQLRAQGDAPPRRTLQRRMSEILNISPKPNMQRRLSEFSPPRLSEQIPPPSPNIRHSPSLTPTPGTPDSGLPQAEPNPQLSSTSTPSPARDSISRLQISDGTLTIPSEEANSRENSPKDQDDRRTRRVRRIVKEERNNKFIPLAMLRNSNCVRFSLGHPDKIEELV